MVNALTPKRVDMMTPHQTEKSLRTLELVIDGKTWKEIQAAGGYDYRTFSGLLAKFPDLARSYQEARALSGTTFEDKALELADRLAGPNEYTGTGVRALEVAMGQYRWSATKRDPRSYAEASAATGTMVPIQINTTLNLGQGGVIAESQKTIWEVQAEVLARGPVEEPKEKDIVDVLEDAGYEIAFDIPAAGHSASPEATEASEAPEDPEEENAPVDPLEIVRQKVHLPEIVPAAVKRRPSTGRPRKGHKGPAATGITRGTYAKMHKSASVKAALGIKDDDNGTA